MAFWKACVDDCRDTTDGMHRLQNCAEVNLFGKNTKNHDEEHRPDWCSSNALCLNS